MSLRELFLSDEFKKYRKELIKVIAREVDRAAWTPGKEAEMRGMLDMAKSIIKVTSDMYQGEEHKEQFRKSLAEDFANLTVQIMRENIDL